MVKRTAFSSSWGGMKAFVQILDHTDAFPSPQKDTHGDYGIHDKGEKYVVGSEEGLLEKTSEREADFDQLIISY